MKLLYNIAIILSITILTAMQTHGQDLPMACVGGSVKYGVKGFNGMSDFTWRITDPDGIDLPASDFTVFGRGDSIEIFWKDTYKGGIYTFEVTESSDFGCTGTPYAQNIVLNSPTIFYPFDGVPASFAACVGNQVALDPSEFKGYLWLADNSTNRIFYTGTAGTYEVRLINDTYSCTYDTIQAIIHSLPIVDLGKDTFLYSSQTLLLDLTNPEFVYYKWSDNSNLSTYTVTGQAGTQNISVLVRDINGCENSDTIKVDAADYNHLRIPAAFTPNGDQINDTWVFPARPEGSSDDIWQYFENVDTDVKVFNRWGRLVWKHHSNGGDYVGWDGRDLSGRPLPMDSYHYIITFKVGEKSYVYKGSVTIIR